MSLSRFSFHFISFSFSFSPSFSFHCSDLGDLPKKLPGSEAFVLEHLKRCKIYLLLVCHHHSYEAGTLCHACHLLADYFISGYRSRFTQFVQELFYLFFFRRSERLSREPAQKLLNLVVTPEHQLLFLNSTGFHRFYFECRCRCTTGTLHIKIREDKF